MHGKNTIYQLKFDEIWQNAAKFGHLPDILSVVSCGVRWREAAGSEELEDIDAGAGIP
jgi:hypothetical protein